MKKYFSSLIFLFFTASMLLGQAPYYVNLDNASGFDRSPYQTQFEAATQEIIDVLPEDYRSQFKVFNLGFYPLSEYMNDDFQLVWDEVKQDVSLQSSYYLLIGGQCDSEGLFKSWVELKLPEEWLLECFTPTYINVLSTTIKNKFKTSIDILTLDDFVNLQLDGMNFMKEKISSLANCCQPTLNPGDSCEGCITSEDVYNELISLGFEPFLIGDIQTPDNLDPSCLCSTELTTAAKPPTSTPNIENISEVIDSANLLLTVDGETLDLYSQLSTFANELEGVNFKGFISKSKNFCNPETFVDFETQYQELNVAAWFHIFEVPESEGQDVLFVKMKL